MELEAQVSVDLAHRREEIGSLFLFLMGLAMRLSKPRSASKLSIDGLP